MRDDLFLYYYGGLIDGHRFGGCFQRKEKEKGGKRKECYILRPTLRWKKASSRFILEDYYGEMKKVSVGGQYIFPLLKWERIVNDLGDKVLNNYNYFSIFREVFVIKREAVISSRWGSGYRANDLFRPLFDRQKKEKSSQGFRKVFQKWDEEKIYTYLGGYFDEMVIMARRGSGVISVRFSMREHLNYILNEVFGFRLRGAGKDYVLKKEEFYLFYEKIEPYSQIKLE